ncbi:MAG: secretin N-terminal domain-containing protein [Planctomycetaceae bacterium]
MNPFRSTRTWLGTVAAVTAPLLALTLPLDAGPKRPGRLSADANAAQDSNADEPGDSTTPRGRPIRMRMNYMQAPWSKVLEDYASAVHKDLIADKIPGGKFSRVDFTQYSPKDALRIINKELEKLGYRLLDQAHHVVLIGLKQDRREYQPAVIPSAAQQAAQGGRPNEIQQTAAEVPQRHRASSHTIRTAAAEEDEVEAPVRKGLPARAAPLAREAPVEEAAEAAPPTLTNIKLKARDPVSVLRTMYNAFRAQAEQVDDGPRGLQGFRVFRIDLDAQGRPIERRGARPMRFGVFVDEDNNRLVVEATPQETASVRRLIQKLDRLPGPNQTTVRAIPTAKDAGSLAAALQPELDRLTHESRKAGRRAQRALLARGDDEDDPDDDVPNGPQQGRNGPDDEPEMDADTPEGLLGSLKGDVSVEAVPELGILIIRGNQRDVESVMSVIREIERLSVATTPQLELRLLRHVSSESLAPLLTSVYERLSPARSRIARDGQQPQAAGPSSSIIPIVRPNAILIIAAKAELEAILDLVDRLDQPTDPALEFRVFRLKHAVPDQVVEALEAMYGGGTGAGQQQPGQAAPTAPAGQSSDRALSPRVRVIADHRTNSVIVQARPRDMREVHLLIQNLDTAESASVSQIRIFKLKHAVADELAATLQTAFQSVLTPARIIQPGGAAGGGGQLQQGGAGQGQSAPELRAVRSQILEFLGRDDEQQRIMRTGILADVRVSSDLRTNSVVATAPEQSMELIEALIKQFDRPSSSVAEIKVIPLEKSDATSMVTLLERLFGAQQRTGQQGQGGGFGQQGAFPGMQFTGADDASSTLIPLRLSTDVRTNSVIVTGGAEALRVVEAVLYRLDESDIRQRKTEVYQLRNVPAAQIADAISQYLQTQRQAFTDIDPSLISPFQQIEREVIVVPEPVTNSLIISATPRYFDDVMVIVKNLDQLQKQVLISALLVEVLLDNHDEWGVELGFQDSILFDRSNISEILAFDTVNTLPNGTQTTTQNVISRTGLPGYNFNTQQLGNNLEPSINAARVGAQGLSNFALGRANGDLGYGGLVLSAGSESINVLLRALAARSRVDVLSRPQIRALNNQTASVQVGQEIPRVNGFQPNTVTGFAAPVVEQRSVGIILEVAPRISPEGIIVMQVSARKDGLSNQSVPLFTNPDGSTVDSPIIDTTNALTTVSVRSGQTIVLGGMITKRNETVERKVPLFGDIPVLGQIFRYDFKRSQRTELLIFLTPRIIHSDEEAELFKEIETQRINFVEAEAEALHGPLFGVPGEVDWIGPGAPASVTPLPATPIPPVPGSNIPGPSLPARPMSYSVDDEGNAPTTMMPAEPHAIPAFPDEDLDIDLSQARKRARRDGQVVPAGGQRAASGAAGKASLGSRRNEPTSKSASGKSGAKNSKTSPNRSSRSQKQTAEEYEE